MRPIKFRAWNEQIKKMSENVIYTKEAEDGIQPLIFMQFTGLFDKNGKEIFEGDILSLIGPFPYMNEVYYDDGGFKLKNRYETSLRQDVIDVGQGYVAGNIYRNPELKELCQP